MRQDEISPQLGRPAFCFFYKHSRLEFALKENGYLKNAEPGSNAEPHWKEFTKRSSHVYRISADAEKLISASPKRQVVAADKRLEWQDIDLRQCTNDLEKISQVVKTIRNNLFHGGKHRADGWDDPERTRMLLSLGVAVLDDIAQQTGLEADYSGYY